MSNAGSPQTIDGESSLRIAGFLPCPNPLRRTTTEHCRLSGYTTFPDASTPSIPTSLPSYNDISLPPARFKISPREEEGKEQLPAYSCSLHREAIFEQKMELSSPFDRAGVRRWRRVYAVLHGTLLKLHRPKRTPFFASGRPKGADEWEDSGGSSGSSEIVGGKPVGYYPGELTGCYTLQMAEVGIAADYKKRNFVIRLRAQTEQFLLSAKSVEVFLDWLEALSASVDLSPSLEERSLPRYQTLPRRRRRRQPQQPHPPTTTSITTTPTAAATAPATQTPLSARSETALEWIMGADLRYPVTPPQTGTPTTPPAPTTTAPPNSQQPQIPSGKWSPPRILTAEANIRYARRCMAVLCGDAPRQSNYVVRDGKRYKIVWEKREMVLDEKICVSLPRYEDVVRPGS